MQSVAAVERFANRPRRKTSDKTLNKPQVLSASKLETRMAKPKTDQKYYDLKIEESMNGEIHMSLIKRNNKNGNT